MLLATYIVLIPWLVISYSIPALDHDLVGATKPSTLVGRLIIGSVVAPFIETAIFQWAPIRLLREAVTLPWPLVLLISSVLFGASHYYSWGYVIFAFLLGLVLAYGFAVQYEKKGGRPFMLICIVHGLRNGIASVVA